MKKIPPASELREICQAQKEHLFFMERIGGRRLSIYVTKLFLYTSLSANQITLLSILVSIAGAVLFLFGSPILIIVGALVLYFAMFLDLVDGEVARYRGKASLGGKFWDDIAGFISSSFIFLFLTFGIYRNFPSIKVILFGCAATISLIVKYGLHHWKCAIVLEMFHRRLPSNNPQGELVPKRQDSPPEGFLHHLAVAYNKRLGNFLWRFLGHTNAINFILVAAIVDLCLGRLSPRISAKYNAMYMMLAIYGAVNLIDMAVRLVYMVTTREVETDYLSLVKACVSIKGSVNQKDL